MRKTSQKEKLETLPQKRNEKNFPKREMRMMISSSQLLDCPRPQVDRASIFNASSCPRVSPVPRFKRIREKFLYAKWNGIGFGHLRFKCNEICPRKYNMSQNGNSFPLNGAYPSFRSRDGSIKQSAVKKEKVKIILFGNFS